MSWSKDYKKSIDCNNPKGFSQKAHCAGRKARQRGETTKSKSVNETMIFEEITEDVLNEKLITYGSRKPYGQIVFIAGGAGSGKGFAISNFLDSSSFRVRDVDEMKKQLQILNRLGKITIKDILAKYGRNIKLKDLDLIRKVQKDGYTLQNLNLKNPDHVMVLHLLVKAMGIKEKTLEKLLMGKNNPEVLPNIMFDITAKDVTDITSVVPQLKEAGYKSENIHLTWILTNYVTAMVNNKNRARMVPEDILLKTHEGASNTVWGLVTKALPKGMNGRVDVILNNPEHTTFYTDADGRTIKGVTKGFLSLPLKKEKGGIFSEKLWKDKLFNWVKDNAPESITANMKESIDEGMFSLIDQIRNESKNVKDFIKNVLSDRNFKDMKNDKQFIQYLGSIYESVNEESSEETLQGLKEMAMGDLERIADYADMILDRMNDGQELDSWMYSQITLAVDQLNSVHDAMDGTDGVVESINEFLRPSDVDSLMKEKGIKKIPISSQGERLLKGMVKEKFFDKVTNKERLVYFYQSLGNERFGYGIKGKPLSPLVDRFSNDLMDYSITFGGKMAAYQVAMNIKDRLANREEVDSTYYMLKDYFNSFGMDTNRSRVFQSANFYMDDWLKRNKNIASQIGESIEERVNLFFEENEPTDAEKWSYAKSQAKQKFDVYPSAYANAWASKKYKELGGGWRKKKD